MHYLLCDRKPSSYALSNMSPKYLLHAMSLFDSILLIHILKKCISLRSMRSPRVISHIMYLNIFSLVTGNFFIISTGDGVRTSNRRNKQFK